jgi:hypothetical protein
MRPPLQKRNAGHLRRLEEEQVRPCIEHRCAPHECLSSTYSPNTAVTCPFDDRERLADAEARAPPCVSPYSTPPVHSRLPANTPTMVCAASLLRREVSHASSNPSTVRPTVAQPRNGVTGRVLNSSFSPASRRCSAVVSAVRFVSERLRVMAVESSSRSATSLKSRASRPLCRSGFAYRSSSAFTATISRCPDASMSSTKRLESTVRDQRTMMGSV